MVCGSASVPAHEAQPAAALMRARARARARSPLFGGATQNGATGAAYPGQFNFWADVRGPPCCPTVAALAQCPRLGAGGPYRRPAAARLLCAVKRSSGAARTEHTPPDALARAAGAGDY